MLYGVAMTPDGNTVACGGWTGSWDREAHIYIFDRANGSMVHRITGLPRPTLRLAFSADGRYLAATLLGNSGVRLYQTSNWALIGEDKNYNDDSYSAHFSNDGHLVTTSLDGFVRLYQVDANGLHLTAKAKAPGGKPFSARFSPDSSKIAIGSTNQSTITVFSAHDLSVLYSPNTSETKKGVLSAVAWSSDGSKLYAGGKWNLNPNQHEVGKSPVRIWSNGGKGNYVDVEAADNTVMDMVSQQDGSLVYGTHSPTIGILNPTGQRVVYITPGTVDYRDSRNKLVLSSDASKVGFLLPNNSKATTFDLTTHTIAQETETGLTPPKTTSQNFKITDWMDTSKPYLNGTLVKLYQNETSRALAIAHNSSSFIIGSEWRIQNIDNQGKQLWQVRTPAVAWAVNISENGKMAVVAYGDGTIRWHRMADGKELLSFFLHADQKRWIVWTPEGFFDHSPGGDELIGFHVNRGKDKEAEFIPVSKLYNQFYRPDLVIASFEGKNLTEFAKAIDIKRILSITTLPPIARMLTKPASTQEPEKDIAVELCDIGGGIGDITIMLNSTPISVESGGRSLRATEKKRDGQCYSFRRTLSLNHGDNIISVMAYNKDNTIESKRDSVNIRYTSTFTGKPNLHILTVAVDKYRDGDLHLKYSKADAKAIAEQLRKQGAGIFGNITTYSLSDADVSRAKLESMFTEIGRKTRREDLFVLFVAGHGITYSKDGSFYYLPVEFRYTQDDDIPKHGVSMNDFKKYLANIQASKSLLLLDTCNSGSFAEAIASRGLTEKTAINKLTRAVGRHTIVASSKSQVALEGFQGHGAFSWVILEGMQGKAVNSNGHITVNSLVSYVESTLPELTYKKWGYEQIPQKNLVGEDFSIGTK